MGNVITSRGTIGRQISRSGNGADELGWMRQARQYDQCRLRQTGSMKAERLYSRHESMYLRHDQQPPTPPDKDD